MNYIPFPWPIAPWWVVGDLYKVIDELPTIHLQIHDFYIFEVAK